MSLDRYSNIEEILAANPSQPVVPLKWTEELAAAGYLEQTVIEFENNSYWNNPVFTTSLVEVHVYSATDGSYVESTTVPLVFDPNQDSINIDSSEISSRLSIKNGTYLCIFNILQNRLGDETYPSFYIQEISTDRTELYLRGVISHPDYATELANLDEGILFNSATIQQDIRDGNIILNFGKNRYSTVLAKQLWTDPDGVVVKLLKPLPEDLAEQDNCWINYELSDSVVKYISFVYNEVDKKVYLRSANFDANAEYNTITETEFKSYTDLLGSSTSTSEQIIQTLLSGSFVDSPIGIDYSGFQNFVFYSSAAERLANFKYKLQQIEHYDAQIELLQTSASIVPTLGTDLNLANARKSAIIGSFDGFEKWLYNEPTSSLFTHQTVYDTAHRSGNPTRLEGGVLASDTYQIQPYPKFLSSSYGGGEYVNHHSTSSIATEWYNGTLASASLYDELNDNILLDTIPEHIRLDSNNDQYELFVNMIGHHFDILYSYADALAKTYHPIEHPKLGHSKETLYNVAKSLGWKLFDGKQASALWQYKLGKSETGSLASTGSIFTKSDEDITTEVWRRIVNNLPYLLKTKGTARGVKALMNTYGIPQTLLSIREYGGPKVSEDTPLLIEDRFSYALQMVGGTPAHNNSPDNGSKLVFGAQNYETNFGTWGYQRAGLSSGEEIPSQTREWRFKPAVKENMLLASIGFGVPKWEDNFRPSVHIGLQYTASYSGSDEYGRIIIAHDGGSNAITASTPWVPLYDGEFWNVRWFWQSTASLDGLGPTDINDALNYYNAGNYHGIRYTIQTQKASDYITGKVVHQASASYEHDDSHGSSHASQWSSATATYPRQFILGGDGGKGTNYSIYRVGREMSKMYTDGAVISQFPSDASGAVMTFSGSIQEFREWLEDIGQEAFDLHTLNPTSYVSGKTPSSSFDTLVRHYPLGTDLNAIDHSIHKFLTGSYPASLKFGDLQEPILETTSSGGTYAGNMFASMSKFPTPTNAQRGNYEPVEETYYIQGVSLGATLPKSQKIRFDDNDLISRLSPQATAEVSRFDNASLDSNRLGLFYSMADQINKDIFNHIGDVELDDYVGDPDDQYEYEYHDLTHFAKEYWKKYSDRNDINAFIRIFSQFDFALFESIRQMLPDRIDEVMGLLVEPNILERAKAVPFKRPEQSSHHYDTLLTGLSPSASGEYPFYEGEASGSPIMTGEVPFSPANGDNGYSDIGNYFGAVIQNTSASTDYFTKHIFSEDERPTISSSALNIYAVEQAEYPFIRDDDFRWDIADGGNIKVNDDVYMAESAGTVEGLPFATDKVRVQFETYTQTDTIQDIRVNVAHLDNASGGQAILYGRIMSTNNNSADSLVTVDSTAHLYHHLTETAQTAFTFSGTNERLDTLIFKDVHIPRRTNVTLEIFYTSQLANGVSGHSIRPRIDSIDFIRTISKAGFSSLDDVIDIPRSSDVFRKKVLHYHETNSSLSKFRNEELRVVSESLHYSLFTNADDAFSSPSKYTYSSSLSDSHYRDDENNKIESKYLGSQISAPGVNVISGYSELGYEPIVEIFITNPNQVVYNSTPAVTSTGQENPGNVSVTAGPSVLIARPARPARQNRSFRR